MDVFVDGVGGLCGVWVGGRFLCGFGVGIDCL